MTHVLFDDGLAAVSFFAPSASGETIHVDR